MPDDSDPKHVQTRNTLRVIGPVLVLVAIVLFAVGFLAAAGGDFGLLGPCCIFTSFGLGFVGAAISMVAFTGAVNRYMAKEVAPVQKDVANYMMNGTRDSIRDVAAAVGEGLRSASTADTPEQIIRCHKCNTDNKSSADFCKACGTPLRKTRPCPNCGELNDPDARFCDECGKPLTQA